MTKKKQKELETQVSKLSSTCHELDRQLQILKERNLQLVAKLNATIVRVTAVLNELVG